GLVVLAALVVILVGDALVAVQEVIPAIAVQEPDEQGFEVQAGGAVEAVVEHDPHFAQVLLLLGLEVLVHAPVSTARLADIDVVTVLDEVDDGPVGEAGEAFARLTDGLGGEAELLDLKAGHTSCSVPSPFRRGTSRECARASRG